MIGNIHTGLIEKRSEISTQNSTDYNVDYNCLIAEKLEQMMPCKWNRIILHGRRNAESSSPKFFFFDEEWTIYYSEDIPVQYEVNQEKSNALLKELAEIIQKLFRDAEYATWNTFTFYLDQDGKYMMKLSNEQDEECSELENELLWVWQELGAMPVDKYRKEVLKRYLKAHNYEWSIFLDDDDEDEDEEDDDDEDEDDSEDDEMGDDECDDAYEYEEEESIGFVIDYAFRRHEEIHVHPYILIYGMKIGTQLQELSERIVEIGTRIQELNEHMMEMNPQGNEQRNVQKSIQKNTDEYTELIVKFQELLQSAGGLNVINDFTEKENEKNGVKEALNKYYYEPMEKEKIAQQEKEMQEQKAVKMFEEYGILPEWYEFKNGGPGVVSYDGKNVYWRGVSKSIHCTVPEKAYEIMLDKLRRYKKTYEFEKLDTTFYVDRIIVVNNECGSYKAYTGKGYIFEAISFNGKQDEGLINQGYHFRLYDQYQGYWIYEKTMDDSVFEQMSFHCEMKISEHIQQRQEGENAVFRVKLVYDIPKDMRETIHTHLKSNHDDLEIENYELYEEIIEYFTEERLRTDAEKAYRVMLDKLRRYEETGDSEESEIRFEICHIKVNGSKTDISKDNVEQMCFQCRIELTERTKQGRYITTAVYDTNMIYDIPNEIREKVLEYFRLLEESWTERRYELYKEIVRYYTEEKLRKDMIYKLY